MWPRPPCLPSLSGSGTNNLKCYRKRKALTNYLTSGILTIEVRKIDKEPNQMSQSLEATKLEAMYYHTREPKHIRFLESNELYAWFRTVNTFKGGKCIVNGMTIVPEAE